ncbi:hypothetical protein [Planococcus shenhongbingii]|uniref:Uncharacterized protein n=1 Tax=Planococcus shenhongbingii TaxID=3058398 RepID=A0ABT8NEG7_9BACL|nr:hypothetical protein [Planococcus sp. N017]MDN7246286.1 hypothetical protein [Planococcus sp. N017]
MKKYTLGFGASAALLLVGCGTSEESKVESTESSVQADSSEVVEVSASEKESNLESSYIEILKYFSSYKLPEEDTVADPTDGQKTGIAIGWILDAAELGEFEEMTVSNASDQMAHPISRLE